MDLGLDKGWACWSLVVERVVVESGSSWSDKDGFLGLGESERFWGGFGEDFAVELQEMVSLFLVGFCLIGVVKKIVLFESDCGIVKWTSRAVERVAAAIRERVCLG